MARETEISWTDATFNPWVGCTKVSPGCAHCYSVISEAGRSAMRLGNYCALEQAKWRATTNVCLGS